MISGLFIQSRRRERGQGVVGSHMILWGKSLFFFSPQRLTKNIFKNYSLLLTQRFSRFRVRHYYYSMFTVSGVQYSTWKGLHSTAQASLVNSLSTLPASRLLQDCECTTRNHTQFSSHLFCPSEFFFVFFSFFLTIKNSYEMWHPVDARTGKASFILFFSPNSL